jgi:tetratricopeptide (TPR) repeat protein
VVHQRDEAREFAQLFLDDVSDKLVPIAGSTPLVEQLTHKTLDYYRNAVDPKSGPRGDRMRLGRAWKKIGRLALEVDKNKEAESAFTFALEVARRLVDEQPNDPDARALLSETLIGLGDLASERGDSVKAEAFVLEAVGHAQAAHETKSDHVDALDTLSRGNSRLASVRLALGRTRDAVEPAKASLQYDKKLAALLPDNEVMQENICISLESVSAVLARDQQLDEAQKLCDEAVQRNTALLQKHPNSVNSLRGGVWYGLSRARLARLQGDADTATRSLERAYALGLQLVEKEPNDSQGRTSLALVEVQNGHAEDAFARLHALGDAAFDADSIEVYAQSMFFTGRYDELLALAPKAHLTTRKAVYTLAALATALQGDASRASQLATEAGHAGPTPMTWPLDLVSERLEHPKTPLESRAWQLARQIDAAERKMDIGAVDLALLSFAHDVTQAVEKR